MAEIISEFFNALGTAVMKLVPGVDTIAAAIVALVLVIVGYILAKVIADVVVEILKRAQIDELMKTHNLAGALRGYSLPGMIGALSMWWIFMIFLTAAVGVQGLNLGILSSILRGFVDWLPIAITAVIIVVAGILMAWYAAGRIDEMKFALKGIVANVVEWVIVLMAIVMALDKLEIDTTIIVTTFVTLVQALAIAVALGIGIAVGLGGKDTVSEIAKANKEKIRKTLGL